MAPDPKSNKNRDHAYGSPGEQTGAYYCKYCGHYIDLGHDPACASHPRRSRTTPL